MLELDSEGGRPLGTGKSSGMEVLGVHSPTKGVFQFELVPQTKPLPVRFEGKKQVKMKEDETF